MTSEIYVAMRHAASEYKWHECEKHLRAKMEEIEFETSFSLALDEVKLHLGVFEAERSDVRWIGELLKKLKEFKPIEYEGQGFKRYVEESHDYGQRAFIDSISILDTAFRHYTQDEITIAIPLLIESIQASMAAKRYHLWKIERPEYVQYFDNSNYADSDEKSLEWVAGKKDTVAELIVGLRSDGYTVTNVNETRL